MSDDSLTTGGASQAEPAGSTGDVPGQATNGAPAAGDWRATLLPEDIRDVPTFQKFKDPGSLARSYYELEKMQRGSIRLPKPDAPPEAWEKDVFSKTRPESPDKYILPKPKEGGLPIDEGAEQWYREKVHALGLNQLQAAPLYEAYLERETGRLEAYMNEQKQGLEELKQEWGNGYDNKLALARAFVARRPKLVQLLDSTGLNINPVLVEVFSEMGAAMEEDRQPAGATATSGESAKAIKEKINAIYNDEKHPFNDRMATHQSHEDAVEEVNGLWEQYMAAGGPPPPKKKG